MTTKVSFIIPHKGRIDMLAQTLASIGKQNVTLRELEVIVVTHEHELKTSDFDLPETLPLKIIQIASDKTISASRNLGAKNSTGYYLAFLDADIYLAENWVTTMEDLLEADNARVIVSAMQQCEPEATALERLRMSLSNAQLDMNVDFLTGRNLFMSRETFNQIGGFPEHLITSEDYYFTDQANQIGDLYCSTKTSYIHIGEDKTFRELFKKEKWRGQSNLQSIKGRRVSLRELPSFFVPIQFTIGSLLALVLFAIGLISYGLVVTGIALLPLFAYSYRAYTLSKGSVNWLTVYRFYLYYFPARAYGTVVGLFKSIGADNK